VKQHAAEVHNAIPCADLLSVLNCPEWPAASLLLTRFIGILNGNRGLTSANAVRQWTPVLTSTASLT